MNKESNVEREKWQQKAIMEMNSNDDVIRTLKTQIDTLEAEKNRHLETNAIERENWAIKLKEASLQHEQNVERMRLEVESRHRDNQLMAEELLKIKETLKSTTAQLKSLKEFSETQDKDKADLKKKAKDAVNELKAFKKDKENYINDLEIN